MPRGQGRGSQVRGPSGRDTGAVAQRRDDSRHERGPRIPSPSLSVVRACLCLCAVLFHPVSIPISFVSLMPQSLVLVSQSVSQLVSHTPYVPLEFGVDPNKEVKEEKKTKKSTRLLGFVTRNGPQQGTHTYERISPDTDVGLGAVAGVISYRSTQTPDWLVPGSQT